MIFRLSVVVWFLATLLESLFSQDALEMPHGDAFDLSCESCHSTENWVVNREAIRFDHDATGYVLIGNHSQLSCRECHQNLIFNHIGIACADCHDDVHKNEFGSACADCHSPVNWENRGEQFELHLATNFPLLGAHAVLDCQACHISEQRREYLDTPVECKGCHLETFMSTLDPSHIRARFDMACENCHLPNAQNWQQAIFEHAQTFPLLNGHSRLQCIDCHSDRYYGLSVECFNCHQSDYNSVLNPDHKRFGFPTTCADCHNTSVWDDAEFEHFTASGFALNGAHETILCIDCHVNNQLTGLPRECFGCHEADYNQTDDPDHSASQFDHDCTLCHTTSRWEDADFDHALTQFPLTGKHQEASCSDCHGSGVYTGLSTECFSCHESDYASATDPNHQVYGFPTACAECHNTTTWGDSDFEHFAASGFALAGEHERILCSDCHINNQLTGLPRECFGCHEPDFKDTSDPDHETGNFSHNCLECHSEEGWTPSTFDHTATNFPLTGRHLNITCTDCHESGVFSGLATDCFSCHESEYNSADDPDHVANQFDHDCTICHNTSSWEDAGFDHNLTQFALVGAHVTVVCIDCHSLGYTDTPMECYACHQTDYESAESPGHQISQLSINCEDCHTSVLWESVTYDHDAQYFPIYSGKHREAWDECIDCHVTPGTITQFECIYCHEHSNKREVDDKHKEYPTYTYESQACKECHPTGEGEIGGGD